MSAHLSEGAGCETCERIIGVGASKFLGVQRIFVQIFPKSCLPTFAQCFLVWPPKNGLHLFFCTRWAPFLPKFSRILPRHLSYFFGFSRILLRISRILPKFSGISPKSSTNQNFLGVCLHPRLLHHYSWLFWCWSLLCNNNMATNLQRFTLSAVVGVLPYVTWTQTPLAGNAVR